MGPGFRIQQEHDRLSRQFFNCQRTVLLNACYKGNGTSFCFIIVPNIFESGQYRPYSTHRNSKLYCSNQAAEQRSVHGKLHCCTTLAFFCLSSFATDIIFLDHIGPYSLQLNLIISGNRRWGFSGLNHKARTPCRNAVRILLESSSISKVVALVISTPKRYSNSSTALAMCGCLPAREPLPLYVQDRSFPRIGIRPLGVLAAVLEL